MFQDTHTKLLRMDPEEAHDKLTTLVRRFGWIPIVRWVIAWKYHIPAELKVPVVLKDVTFPHAVGMAAGFDKQGLLTWFLQVLGFAYVEVGSVLPEPQAGNPRKRIFRPAMNVLINRMGFNSLGADAVRHNLRCLWRHLRIPIGISLGMNKSTPLANAWMDYVRALDILYDFASYVVINVSSPNTPGLRDLQGGQYLEHLVGQVSKRMQELARGGDVRPLLVKLSPDETDDDTIATVQAALRGGADGVILTNTSSATRLNGGETQEVGGVSGELIYDLVLNKIKLVRKSFPDLFIIGVGGITTVERAVEMKRAGADLIQIYTGFIFQGPGFIRRILVGLKPIM